MKTAFPIMFFPGKNRIKWWPLCHLFSFIFSASALWILWWLIASPFHWPILNLVQSCAVLALLSYVRTLFGALGVADRVILESYKDAHVVIRFL